MSSDPAKSFLMNKAVGLLLENRLYEILQKSWLDFAHRHQESLRNTNINENFVTDDSAQTGLFLDEYAQPAAWHRHLQRLGMKVTYRNSSDHHYVRDPSQIYADAPVIEIGREDAAKILTLGHVP